MYVYLLSSPRHLGLPGLNFQGVIGFIMGVFSKFSEDWSKNLPIGLKRPKMVFG